MSIPADRNQLITYNSAHANFMPTPLESLIERDFKEYQKEKEKKAKEEEKKAKEAAEAKKDDTKDEEGKTEVSEVETKDDEDGVETVTTTTTTTVVQTVKKVKKPKANVASSESKSDGEQPKPNESGIRSRASKRFNLPDHIYQQEQEWTYGIDSAPDGTTEPTKYTIIRNEEDELYLGLRVYTHKDVPAVVVGILKVGAERKDEKKEGTEENKADEKQDVARQSLSSLVASLEDTCDCDACRGRMSHPGSI
jgi:hypothetical protein